MTGQRRQEFIETVWQFYAENGRDLPWRTPAADGTYDPYRIMVSEIMLQQTQVRRVITKFRAFMDRFPDVQSLAAAPLHEVLAQWSGLGYNRRAKYLHQAAREVCEQYQAVIPDDQVALTRLPGVGINTAGAIMAYAHNSPVIFIETNIRTVYIHHFFSADDQVTDAQIREQLALTLDHHEPRQWYWALMDYGTWLKQTVGNLSRQSTAYSRQSAFAGSRRQVRGKVLAVLLESPRSVGQLTTLIPDHRLAAVLHDLTSEGMIELSGAAYRLAA